jgi:hypothetical protein
MHGAVVTMGISLAVVGSANARLSLPVLPPPGRQTYLFIGVFFGYRTGNLTTQVTNECHPQREKLISLIR